jgi:hypothetical protein
MKMTVADVAARVGISAFLAVSGVIHAVLYGRGYRDIPTVGTAFLVQASIFCALAVVILFGAPRWLWYAGSVGAAASLVAFGLSRTVGLAGFSERGWSPAPYAVISVVAEVLTVVIVAGAVAWDQRRRRLHR